MIYFDIQVIENLITKISIKPITVAKIYVIEFRQNNTNNHQLISSSTSLNRNSSNTIFFTNLTVETINILTLIIRCFIGCTKSGVIPYGTHYWSNGDGTMKKFNTYILIAQKVPRTKKHNKKEIVEDRYSYDHSICVIYDQKDAKNKI